MSSFSKVARPGNGGTSRALFAFASRNSERVFVPLNESALDGENTNPSFYCVHAITGAAGSDFLELGRRLDPFVRFFGVQSPPKKVQEKEFGSSVESIADYYANALTNFQPSGVILLGGWSAGVAIALEMAENLRARGREVGILVALDSTIENTGGELKPADPRFILEFLSYVPVWIIAALTQRYGTLATLARRFFNASVAQGKRIVGRVTGREIVGSHPVELLRSPDRFPAAQRLFILRLFEAIPRYKPRQYSGRVVSYEARITTPLRMPQVSRKWRSVAPHVEIVRLNGTHTSILEEPQIDELARDMCQRLAAFSTRCGTPNGGWPAETQTKDSPAA